MNSPVYRVILIAGGILILGLILVVGVFSDASGLAGYAILGAITLVLMTILIYWWVQLLHKPAAAVPGTAGEGSPGIEALRSWNTLFAAMTIQGGDSQAAEADRRASQRNLLEWYAWANLIALYPLFWVWLAVLGIYSIDGALMVAVYLVLIAAMLVRTYFMFSTGRQSGNDGYLLPLGLDIVDPAQSSPEWFIAQDITETRTLVVGERYGRSVTITIDSRLIITQVAGNPPSFQITSKAGKLVANDQAPPAVKENLRSLRKAKRWQGIVLAAGEHGMQIQRSARKENMWLYDLWLVERLYEAIEMPGSKGK
jgi:hypothetical protein